MIQTVLLAVALINLVTFAVFGLDKWRAKRSKWRIPEAWLLLLSFTTGMFGGWLAMSTFRHKTQKLSFRVKMVLVSIVNLNWPLLYLWWRDGGGS